LACTQPSAAQQKRKARKPSPTSRVAPPPRAVEEIPQAWKEFTPPDGRFKIFLPGTPEPDHSSDPDGARNFGLTTTIAIYGAGYKDFPAEEQENPDFGRNLLNLTTENMSRVPDIEVVSQTEIKRAGYAGRELRFKLPEDGIYVDRMLLVGGRLYQLSIAIRGYYSPTARKGFYDWLIARYLESFELTPEK
ncbi:MAG: hypothetical protein JO360_04445, partial [Acidobacteria bacterium]|nr:hypothetical protein [Acidobacteriota bacterium]